MSIIVNSELDKIYDDMLFTLGETAEQDDKRFRFVKYNSGAGSVNAVAGGAACQVSTDTTNAVWYETTMDVDSAAAATAYAVPKSCIGFYQAALTDGKYGWVQDRGRNRKAMITDGNVSRGDQISVDTAVNGGVKPLAGGSPDLPTVAIALKADSGTALAVGDAQIRTGA